MQVARNAMTILIVKEPHAAGNTDYFELHCYIHGPITAIIALAPTILNDRTTQTKNNEVLSPAGSATTAATWRRAARWRHLSPKKAKTVTVA